MALKTEGHDYTEAENGKDALAKLSGNQFNFFIVDVNMPEMNGIEFVTQLRKQPGYQKTPVIILTTETEEEMKNLGTKAGANAWMTKPFQKEDLIAKIKTLI
jgi:two-component system chemotaxis response regulator CheY